MMKKIGILILSLFISGCSNEKNLQETNPIESNEKVVEEIKVPRMIMVNNILYYDTGKLSEIEMRCGNKDGYMKASTLPNEIPTTNDMSNFGINYAYQFGLEDTIDVFINDEIIVFSPRKEESVAISKPNYVTIQNGIVDQKEMISQFLEKVEKQEPAKLVFYEADKKQYYYLAYFDRNSGIEEKKDTPFYIYSLLVEEILATENPRFYYYDGYMELDTTNGMILRDQRMALIEFIDGSITQKRADEFVIFNDTE